MIRLNKKQKKELVLIRKRYGIIAAIMALSIARPKAKKLECVYFIRDMG